MFENPYFLLLIVLSPVLWFFRGRRYFLRHSYVKVLARIRFWKWSNFLYYLAWLLLVLAAAGPFYGFSQSQHKWPLHKYVIVQDGSGSMVDNQKLKGVGEKLKLVQQGNKAFLSMLGKRSNGKDLVGSILYSDNPFIVSFLVDDPSFVNRKLDAVDYTRPPMCNGTQTEKALWAALVMLLVNNKISDDIDALWMYTLGDGWIYDARNVGHIIDKFKSIAHNASIVIFSDGEWYQPQGGVGQVSCYKVLDLCRLLGVRVYLISVQVIDNKSARLINDTGGFAQIISEYDRNKIIKAYENILESQSADFIVETTQEKLLLSSYLAISSLALLLVAFLLKQTLNRNYTEV